MVADVRDRGADSPHARVVSAAAHTVFDPVIDAIRKGSADLGAYMQVFAGRFAAATVSMAELFSQWTTEVGRQLAPLAKAYAEAEAASKRTKDKGEPST